MWEQKREEAQFRAQEAAHLVELAKEQGAQLDIRAREAVSLSTLESDSRQVAALQLSKAQTDLLVEVERTQQLQASIEAEKTRVRELQGKASPERAVMLLLAPLTVMAPGV